jgi:hypothetical protein
MRINPSKHITKLIMAGCFLMLAAPAFAIEDTSQKKSFFSFFKRNSHRGDCYLANVYYFCRVYGGQKRATMINF